MPIQIQSGSKKREKQHKRVGRSASLYEPGWYKHRVRGESNYGDNKNFIFDLDLMPVWAAPMFLLPEGAKVVGMRDIKGQYGREAFDAEIGPNGTNQYTSKKSH